MKTDDFGCQETESPRHAVTETNHARGKPIQAQI
jgi:hypothetical protein